MRLARPMPTRLETGATLKPQLERRAQNWPTEHWGRIENANARLARCSRLSLRRRAQTVRTCSR